MNTVNYITPSDGDIYLVNNQTYVNSGGTDFDKIYNNITVDDSLENIFAGAAKEFGINENFLKAVAQAESGFDPDAVSYCGAQGIMQLMPYTAESYGVTDPFDARQNVYAGAQMLSELLDSYDGMLRSLLQHIMLAVVQYRSMEECLRMMKHLIISVRLMIY